MVKNVLESVYNNDPMLWVFKNCISKRTSETGEQLRQCHENVS